ncbi:hypothetical protein BDZ97DRAFT_1842537, partial [Flammula alnicola]
MSSLTALFAMLAVLPAVFALPSSSVQLSRRQNGTDPNGPLAGWTFVGCFSDNNPASRTLLEATVVNA